MTPARIEILTIMETRIEKFEKLFPDTPKYRVKQMEGAVFRIDWENWNDASVFPKEMREILEKNIPWVSYKKTQVFESKNHDARKTLIELLDGDKIETVLMTNAKGTWTICVSSQVGCPMGCLFCATGKMGLKRNLTSDEIIDQYRFWNYFIKEKKLPGIITNIVFMGMGEPLLNYKNIKDAINAILQNTEIGQTHITVSTIGIPAALDMILEDKEWPKVLIAISLHSADTEIRKKIVPSSTDNSIDAIAKWSKQYLRKFGNRSHYLTFEYIMLKGVNDSLLDAKKLAKLVTTTGDIKVNLIPYNSTGSEFETTPDDAIEQFVVYLKKHRVTATVRRSKGQDIMAACGQLAVK